MLKSEPYNVKAVWGIQRERERERAICKTLYQIYINKKCYIT